MPRFAVFTGLSLPDPLQALTQRGACLFTRNALFYCGPACATVSHEVLYARYQEAQRTHFFSAEYTLGSKTQDD